MSFTRSAAPGRSRPLFAAAVLLAGAVVAVLPASPAAAVTRTLAYFTGVKNGQGTVSVVDTTDNSVIGTIPGGDGPLNIAIAPDAKTAYVSQWSTNLLSKIDLTTNTVVKTITVGNGPRQVDFANDGQKLYVANSNSGTVSVINTATDAVSKTITVGSQPMGVYIAPHGFAYVPNLGSDTVSVIDTVTDEVIKAIPVADPSYSAVKFDGSRVYVTSLTSGQVTMIKTSTLEVEGQIPDATDPQAVLMSAGALYIGHGNGGLTIINSDNSKTTLASPGFLRAASTASGGRVYFAGLGSNSRVFTAATNSFAPIDTGLDTTFGVAVATVTTPWADLGLTISATPSPAEAGTNYVVDVPVTNYGPDAATNPEATVTYTGAARTIELASTGLNGSCEIITPGDVHCTWPTLAANAKPTITMYVKPQAAGTIEATATVKATPTDPVPANNTAKVTTTVNPAPTADLTVTTTDSADPVEVGTPYTYEAVVKNNGPNAATGVKAIIELEGADRAIQSATRDGGTCTINSASVTCPIGALAKDADTTITVTVKPEAAGTITATTTVEGDQADPASANNTSAASTTVKALPSADLSVTTTESADPVEIGTPYTYKAVVKNNGPDAATGVKATIAIDGADRTIQSATRDGGTCAINSATVTCPIGDLADNADTTITVTIKPEAAGTIEASATVEADQADPATANNTSSVSTTIKAPPAADLSVVTTDSPDPVALAGTFVSTSKVTNLGPDAATGVSTTVTLTGPAALILEATSSQGACTIAGPVATCTIGNLAKNATATITLTVEPQATGTAIATAKVTGAQADPAAANNTAVQNTTVNNANGCTIIGTAGNNFLAGGAGMDVICLLGGNDTVNAFGGNDIVYGGSGTDTVQGDTGNDTLYGGLGNDTLTGGPGTDKIDGGPGTDICTAGETYVNCP
ncbi:CARDB domain-containing protein [Actinoplanes sp. NPDC000266]